MTQHFTAPVSAPVDPVVDSLLDELTLDEQISLLAGSDTWHTVPIERLGIPRLRTTDGPAGAHGTRFDGPASINIPCSTALAATWDPPLVEAIGHLLGRETRAKGARVLLAPTVNLHRTPIGGRNFECMSEDPLLTSRIAVAYVQGVQDENVACCIKHFVGNDSEFERMSIDNHIDERTLHELYLAPFEAAVRDGGVLGVMTAYNRLNGPFTADSEWLVNGVLRAEWGFDGIVVSDWFGLHSTAEGVVAGVDLEMPGPTRHRGPQLRAAVDQGDVSPAQIRSAAGNVLALLVRVGAFDDGEPGPEATRHDLDDISLGRRAAAEGMVLLRNRHDAMGRTVLPMDLETLHRVAVVGPGAADGQIMGGGSAHVTPTEVIQPLEGLRARLGQRGIEVTHAPGCRINKRLADLADVAHGPIVLELFPNPDDLDDRSAIPAKTRTLRTARLIWPADPVGRSDGAMAFGARVRSTLEADVSGEWCFGVESVGPARVFIDGQTIIDNTAAPAGGSFFGTGKAEVTGTIVLEAGRTYQIVTETRFVPDGPGLTGLNVGVSRPMSGDPIADAVVAATGADLTVVVVGTNADWEGEGWDRTTLALPGDQDELVRRVAAASRRTVVVVNAGSPVTMPWLDDVDAVVMAWFPGQEMGHALADVLVGDVEPQGRLPVTFPQRLEDTPAFEHYPGRNGVAKYLEGRLVGYRWYDTVGRQPLFPFGFGLGYGHVEILGARSVDAFTLDVDVRTTGSRDGVEVIQVYAHRPQDNGPHDDGPHDNRAPDDPEQALVGFAKVAVPAGESRTVRIPLDARSFSMWCTTTHAWVRVPGAAELRVGSSSRDVAARVTIVVPDE